jgi:hypothetical protein
MLSKYFLLIKHCGVNCIQVYLRVNPVFKSGQSVGMHCSLAKLDIPLQMLILKSFLLSWLSLNTPCTFKPRKNMETEERKENEETEEGKENEETEEE